MRLYEIFTRRTKVASNQILELYCYIVLLRLICHESRSTKPQRVLFVSLLMVNFTTILARNDKENA